MNEENKVPSTKDAEKLDKKAEKAKKKLEKERAKREKENKHSSAEAAREKRKESVKKSAEKQAEREKKRAEKKAKETPKQHRTKVISWLCAAAAVIVIVFLCFFGVPERVFTAVKVSDGSKVTVAEYEYYYRSLYNYYETMSQQYETYYSSYYGTGAGKSVTGFDYTKTPGNQKFSSPAGQNLKVDKSYGDEPTWADYFEQMAVETAQQYTVAYNKAVKDGYKMTKSEKKEENEFIEQLRKSAANNDYSLDAYLRSTYGRGMTEKRLRKIYEKQTVAARYLDDTQKNIKEGITDKEIEKAFAKDPEKYTTVSLRYFNFTAELTEDSKPSKSEIKKANAKLKANAQKLLDAANDSNFTEEAAKYAADDYKDYYKSDDSYTTMSDASYDSIKSSVSKAGADWAFKNAKVGDKKIIEVKNDAGIASYYVLLLTKAPSRDESHAIDVRHILFQASSDSSGSEATHTEEEAKKLAEDELKKWKDGDATDASFAKLAKADSEDSGTASDGGICADVTPSASYVKEFLDWCFADGRKAGDSGIVKTEYGYHVMYLKSVAADPQWKADVREALAAEKNTAFTDGLTKKDSLKEVSGFWGKKVRHRVEKYAGTVIANASSSNSNSAALAAASAGN